MTYLKIRWLHESNDEPVLIYSELADDRSELRKVEVFPSGEFGYAYEGGSKGTTQLSETTLPTEQNISGDQQFELVLISKGEFDEVWEKATSP